MSGIDIDTLYDAFCSRLPARTRAVALDLASTLGLAPSPGVGWSQVFKHEVTLQAPALFADAMPRAGRALVEKAVFAHMLSVIEAFGTDRIADAQVADAPELREVLSVLRKTRDDTLEDVGGPSCRALGADADRRTHDAIDAERRVLLAGGAVELSTYRHISAGKQAVGLPASVALAMRAGFTPSELEDVRSTLMGIWLGLQFQDDVADWEDDVTRGGAWLVAVAGGATEHERTDAAALRRKVFSAGGLVSVLDMASEEYERAAEGAERLGAHRLAAWTLGRVEDAHTQADGERRSPGFVDRLRKLNSWKVEVLG